MKLRLVASNPDAASASPAERVVRKLKFADAELQRVSPDAADDESVRLMIASLRRTLQAAVLVLRAREQAS